MVSKSLCLWTRRKGLNNWLKTQLEWEEHKMFLTLANQAK
jgi:hypothetical protein